MIDIEVKEAMDLSEKESGSQGSAGSQDMKKCCVDCKTTKTPLWRGGPAGPKSLCNACGIKHRKQRRALMGVNKSGSQVHKKKVEIESKESNNSNKLDVSLRLRLLTFGRQVSLRRSSKQRKLDEEEQAAVLLMALSCGSIYA
ncbi:Gata transcription factor [Thalictrum thalictroides]|uniref:Gata transcription factor n=1 Tax=Thalictrum thalictroides TaxID=46969 RepID=A0A7J6WSX5_THATH|nr:Gata transcription factor [Thalictrum thalictroides]